MLVNEMYKQKLYSHSDRLTSLNNRPFTGNEIKHGWFLAKLNIRYVLEITKSLKYNSRL